MHLFKFSAEFFLYSVLFLTSSAAKEIDLNVDGCGKPSDKYASSEGGLEIVGGKDADPHTWPWQAIIGSSGSSPSSAYCGGTLLNSRWVLTAAHCTTASTPASYRVALGAHSRRSMKPEDGVAFYGVSCVFPHPAYDSDTFDNDISLLRLGSEAALTDEVRPVCLPTGLGQKLDTGEVCAITGFGYTTEGGSTATVLQEADVPIIDRSRCDGLYSYPVTDNMLCAGFDQGGVDACQGDSGGPMVCRPGGTDQYELHGAVSWGVGCARAGNPGVYTKVANYLDWINVTMAAAAAADSSSCPDAEPSVPKTEPTSSPPFLDDLSRASTGAKTSTSLLL